MNPETARLRPPRALIFTSGIAVIVLISLGIFYWLMRPPLNDLEHMAQFLSITAAISILIGYAAYRSNWLEHAPSLRWVLLGTYILASLLTFLNVWLTARLMFASEHDLMLATVLLVFAGAIAVALGAFITAAITVDRTRLLATGPSSVLNCFETRKTLTPSAIDPSRTTTRVSIGGRPSRCARPQTTSG